MPTVRSVGRPILGYSLSMAPKVAPTSRTTASHSEGLSLASAPAADAHAHQVDGILQAAADVVLDQGIANVTLEKVAARVGVSKSGLLHYFPSKDLLISALVQRVVSNWREELTQTISRTPKGPTRVLRAMLDGCLAQPDHWSDRMRSTSVAVLAAISTDRKHAEPVREVYAMLRSEMQSDGLHESMGDFVMCAMDGLWMSWVFELRAFSPGRLEGFRAVLRKLIEAHERGIV